MVEYTDDKNYFLNYKIVLEWKEEEEMVCGGIHGPVHLCDICISKHFYVNILKSGTSLRSMSLLLQNISCLTHVTVFS